jgi:hypothetical protein
LTLPPLDAERYFAWFTRTGLDQKAILGWLGDVQFIYRWHESYSSAIWEIGETHHVPVADIRKAILEERNYSRFLCKDGIHPTPRATNSSNRKSSNSRRNIRQTKPKSQRGRTSGLIKPAIFSQR